MTYQKIFKTLSICSVIFAYILSSSNVTFASKNIQADNSKQNFVKGEILIKYKESRISTKSLQGKFDIQSSLNTKNINKVEKYLSNNTVLVKIPENENEENKIKDIQSDPNVEFAQLNYQYSTQAFDTNDPFSTNLWGLDNLNDKDIDLPEAWARTGTGTGTGTGTVDSVVVAVIDTGIAYNHPELNDNLWDGSGCVTSTGASLNDCIYGYDFEEDDKDPLISYSSHGTHVAGTIAAEINNGLGGVGVAPNVKVISLKSSLTTSEIVEAIAFAEENGAIIINASWGGAGNDTLLRTAISNFDGLFIAAAGNETTDNDATPFYPCNYDLDNIICVAATDSTDNISYFSNYGLTSVDVGAPGSSIYSTIADEVFIDESFDYLTVPNLPENWTTSGSGAANWGSSSLGGELGITLKGDYLHRPYLESANSYIEYLSLDLSDKDNLAKYKMSFLVSCDTQYSLAWEDYLGLEFSGSNSIYSEYLRLDELNLDMLLGGPYSDSDNTIVDLSLIIPSSLYTDDFQYRFHWVTDNDGDTGTNGDGCFIDDFKLYKITDGGDEQYSWYSGTSMATPHVVGLAGLLWGFAPNLSVAEMKSVILDNGDSLPALSTKTVSGKRINALNSIMAVEHDIAVDQSTLDFGYIEVGSGSTFQEVTISNEGNSRSLTINDIQLEDDTNYVLDIFSNSINPCAGTGFTLGSGESCTVAVQFSPSISANYSSSLVVLSDDFDESDLSVVLTGDSTNIQVDKTTIDYGVVYKNTESSAETITISNESSSEDLNISDIWLDDSVNFRLDLNAGVSPCQTSTGVTLSSFEECTIGVSFYPTISGLLTTKLNIDSDGSIDTTEISLSGTGRARSGGGGGGGSSSTPIVVEEAFPDISTSVFKTYIKNLKDAGVIKGFSDGNFYPEKPVTRDAMAKFIVEAFDFEIDRSGVPFSDVNPNNDRFGGYIQTLKNLGIVTGYSDGSYKPLRELQRGEATKFIVLALKYKGVVIDENATSNFPDVDENNVFRNYIAILNNLRATNGELIINGYSDGRYGPTDNLSRGAMCKIIWNSMSV